MTQTPTPHYSSGVAGVRPRSPEDDRLDYAEVGLICGPRGPPAAAHRAQDVLPLPGRAATPKTHDGTVLRHMRPTLSELGEYDGTALMEFKTRKNIIYLLNREQRLHLRDGRHAAVPGQPGRRSTWPSSSA